MILYLI